MSSSWRERYMDLVLVPLGLLIMLGYHLFLLFRCLKRPETTVIGFENHSKRAWVVKMMQVDAKDRGLAISVISNNISASTSLCSICLVLSSLLGAWIENSSNSILTSNLVYGDTSSTIISIKNIALLSCFLIAFAAFVQTTRCYVHASFLISMPNTEIPVDYVLKTVIRGSAFWSLGMRALYFAATLILWIFGPIPMFICSVVMVTVLLKLDTNSTPFHEFHKERSHNTLNKNGEELSSVTTGLERPSGNGSRKTGAHMDHNLQQQDYNTPIIPIIELTLGSQQI